jgi:hypothetical protein
MADNQLERRDHGGSSETPETFKAKHMQEEVWAGFEKKFHGGTTVMCVARIAFCGLPACENRKTHGKDTDRSCQQRLLARSVQWSAHRDAGRRPW